MAAVGITGATDDQEALGQVAVALHEMGESDLAQVVRHGSLTWWTEPNYDLSVLGWGFDETYPEHHAMLTVPAHVVGLVEDKRDQLTAAVAQALGTHAYAPLRGLTIQEQEPDPGPTTDDGTPLLERDGYMLTPIEAKFYDELRETGLAFSVQTPLHCAGEPTRRPDFIVFTSGAPIIVELDGHAHHSSREDRTRDAQRDRWSMAHGFHVVRFTGTEVSADPRACVRELRELAKAPPGSRSTAP
jgi:very-short-patch-repair endonuclease